MIDQQSDTWKAIETFVDKEMTTAGQRLTSNLDIIDTTFQRGIYAAMKAIKELPTKQQQPQEEIVFPDYS